MDEKINPRIIQKIDDMPDLPDKFKEFLKKMLNTESTLDDGYTQQSIINIYGKNVQNYSEDKEIIKYMENEENWV